MNSPEEQIKKLEGEAEFLRTMLDHSQIQVDEALRTAEYWRKRCQLAVELPPIREDRRKNVH